ncbi:AAA family ATPase [Haliangium sp.]|uniref:AAA family ATPase n=1 Tax=Haliangium sp. TaxID=2663208 RepID=UPI003D0AD735
MNEPVSDNEQVETTASDQVEATASAQVEATASARRLRVALDNIYLDPNNYRFIDHVDYSEVPPERTFDDQVQRRTTRFVLGKNQELVRDLIASFRENGWLEMDPILVRRHAKGRYVVVEGNRRVATLQHLRRRYREDAIDLGRLDPALFESVPVTLYEDVDELHHLVMAGLHHITGKRRWPAINRARLMRRLRDDVGMDADAVCRALGVSKQDLNLSVRTLALCEAYQASDYGDQFQSEQYNLFREVLKSPAIREWIGWRHDALAASNQHNLERLFSWMSSEQDGDDEDSVDDSTATTHSGEQVLTTTAHVRELGKIIDDANALKRLEETRSLQEATLSSDLLIKNELDASFERCNREIGKLSQRVGLLNEAQLDGVEHMIGRLQGLALARKRQPVSLGVGVERKPFNELPNSQFSSILVERYRGLRDLALPDLGRINLIVGVNNAGKTSLLEAIQLLSRQNDDRAIIDIIRRRGRLEGDPPPAWLVEQLPEEARVSGRFDTISDNRAFVDLSFTRDVDDDETEASYLGTLAIESGYADYRQHSESHFFTDRPRRATLTGGNHRLCRSILFSPFSLNAPEILVACNRASIEAGVKEQVIEFLRTHLDPGLQGIELVDEFRRFVVSHDLLDGGVDLAWFGQGMRWAFQLGLLFAGARSGVLLIDEFESSLHTKLLFDFTRLVQELAAALDVQVFFTTHSKEAVDAFVTNGVRTEDIVGYALVRGDDGLKARRYGGDELARLNEIANFDLRRL